MTARSSKAEETTVTVMRATAEALEVAEDVLHNSADMMPRPEVADRLHAVGDNVTAEAHRIEQRADELSAERPDSDAR